MSGFEVKEESSEVRVNVTLAYVLNAIDTALEADGVELPEPAPGIEIISSWGTVDDNGDIATPFSPPLDKPVYFRLIRTELASE